MSFDERKALSETEIARRIGQRFTGEPPLLDGFRPASVLVPLVWQNDEWHLLFTRRTEMVQSHKGQVSFPGGVAEPGDLSPEDTALREAYEEIGLAAQDVTLLGRLRRMATISNFLITPILARIPWPYLFQISPEEVSRVFTIPLVWLADSNHREEHPRMLPNGVVEDIIYYQLYDGEILWGISARITVQFLEALDFYHSFGP